MGGWPAPLSAGGGAWGAVEQWVPWTHAPPAQPSRAAHCPRSQGCCAQRMAAPLVGAPRSSPTAGRGCHHTRRQLGLPAAPHWGCWATSPRSPRSGGCCGTKSPALAIASFTPTLRDLKRRAEKKKPWTSLPGRRLHRRGTGCQNTQAAWPNHLSRPDWQETKTQGCLLVILFVLLGNNLRAFALMEHRILHAAS